MKKKVGVIGSGSFGITVAKLLSENNDVIVYGRRQEVADQINLQHRIFDVDISTRISATTDIEEVCTQCDLIFPAIPSLVFREIMQFMSPYLKPYHVLIHATKGLDTKRIKVEDFKNAKFDRSDVNTMSEVILQETNVLRVGCMSGPNLAKELMHGLPAACVIASEFDEVIKVGQDALKSKYFTVFSSHDLKGVELAGAFKNIIAIGSGLSEGLGLGKNAQALLITRGLRELIEFGFALGYSGEAFLGVAGIGDMIATAFSENSRNFTFGHRFAKGETKEQIFKSSEEVIEGVNTLKVIYQLMRNMRMLLPITYMLYKTIHEDMDKEFALMQLMGTQYARDVDFVISKQQKM
jgi:glycerol-3-phosphate dehydrogenase (NAD(P)+)